jgi:NitT/TauT family transport system ATP-binding protein
MTPVTAAPAILKVADVSLVYRTVRGEIEALREVDLSVGAGEFVALLGPSGCGKSTLLKIAAGLLRPSSGRVTLGQAPVTAPRTDVGVAFQRPLLLPWKTVRDNVLVPIRAARLPSAGMLERCAALLELMGLSEFATNYPRELSGGMQQRVGLARMLIHDPSLLLMDEPFAALDAMTRETLSLELQRIWMRYAKSVLFITHSIAEAVFLSDRVLVMSARPGRVIESLDIDLPRPRTLETMASAAFTAACDHLRRHFVK